jgi:peptidoglycan/xylan/chitin deacetylase (PgdA/CDA1 family)
VSLTGGGWGPERRRAAVAITFDNLGEASEIERGEWPAEQPLGEHPSVTRALPRVLDLLGAVSLPATFFVEGVNAGIYPDALRSIAGAGHEVALHGWRHEAWAELGDDAERALLARGVDALARLGLRPVGFRPPGGALSPSSLRVLGADGFMYCSPAGDAVVVRDGVAVLPFRWELIDAFHYLPHFGPRRQALVGAPDVLPPSRLRVAVAAALEDAVTRGALLVTLFHPFLFDTDDRARAVTAILEGVRARVDDGAVWCAPMREIAASLHSEV